MCPNKGRGEGEGGGGTGLHRTLHAQCVHRQRRQEKDGGAGTGCKEVGRRTAWCRGDEWGRVGCASYSVLRRTLVIKWHEVVRGR